MSSDVVENSLSKLAGRLGQPLQYFCKKLKHDALGEEEIHVTATVSDARSEHPFLRNDRQSWQLPNAFKRKRRR